MKEALPPIAVVIPARQEAGRLPALLADLARAPDLIAERVVVDGGSTDPTPAVAALAGARVLRAQPGRGGQLLAGIASTTAPWLWLLHADVRLPPGWAAQLRAALATPAPTRPRAWYGDLCIDQGGLGYRLLECLVALRSALLQRPYGDQGLLLRRACYQQVGGLRPLPLMEDLEFVERLGRQGRLCALGLAITVDARRWQRLGLVGTSLSNASLRRAWRRGRSANRLYEAYQNAQRRSSGSSSQP
ncbi:MAG: TIGR04283 family arsenosugar biosynthesis glycosyltransferase [Cyanobacteria bacterium REEB417]|nr:TIGR04283 family arsenosugar biosynthesis glycosyltransferase [Cyanobacteria bacterium REEB417]